MASRKRVGVVLSEIHPLAMCAQLMISEIHPLAIFRSGARTSSHYFSHYIPNSQKPNLVVCIITIVWVCGWLTSVRWRKPLTNKWINVTMRRCEVLSESPAVCIVFHAATDDPEHRWIVFTLRGSFTQIWSIMEVLFHTAWYYGVSRSFPPGSWVKYFPQKIST